MSKTKVAGMAAICAFLFCSTGSPLFAGEKGNSKITILSSNSSSGEKEICWKKDRRLTWDDFRGAIPNDAGEQTAAATYCGIGFETNTITSKNPELKINVYNTFYINNSWAKPEEMNDEVLAHEQGHFDLCEIYTRKLRERLSGLKVNVNTMKPVLKNIYNQLQKEYRDRQEAYENETSHGIKTQQQRNWQKRLEKELVDTEKWSTS